MNCCKEKCIIKSSDDQSLVKNFHFLQNNKNDTEKQYTLILHKHEFAKRFEAAAAAIN